MRWNYKCPLCGSWRYTDWDNRGKTSVENLQPMCQPHNSSKGTKDFKEWLDEEGITKR